MTLFRKFLGPYSSKYGPILQKFSPEVVLEQINCLKKFEGFEFLSKRDGPKFCTFDLTLTTPFPLKMTEIEKDNNWWGKTSAIRLSEYVKIKALSPFSFPRKTRLLFPIFGLFLPGNRVEPQIERLESKFDKIL